MDVSMYDIIMLQAISMQAFNKSQISAGFKTLFDLDFRNL